MRGFALGSPNAWGLGPDDCMARNKALVYGRMTGWGQDGPMANAAGHDINYISLAGALYSIGEAGQKPVPPLNLVGDFGGGGMLLAFGMVCGLLEAQKSGSGQVIDAAMIDGTASLMSMFFSMAAGGSFTDKRGTNLLDGGAHFYGTYETSDGKHISLGSIEPQFYALLKEKAGLEEAEFGVQHDATQWPTQKEKLAAIFKTKTRDEWCAIMEGSDVCFAPVLSIFEAPEHPHNKHRNAFLNIDGVTQPAPSPRFSRTEPEVRHGPRLAGQDSVAVLQAAGFSATDIESLQASKVIPAS